ALLGTDWHNRWTLTGATDWQHCWAALLGTGGCTAGWHSVGHRWAELVGGTAGYDHQGTDQQCPDDRCRSLL
ncbi:unnamed protein product, partial [Staurois parvus]